MAIDPPWRLDPFQNIRDVHWGSAFVMVGGYCNADGGLGILGEGVGEVAWVRLQSGVPVLANAQVPFPEFDPAQLPAMVRGAGAGVIPTDTRGYSEAVSINDPSLIVLYDRAGTLIEAVPPLVIPSPPGALIFSDAAGKVYATQTDISKYTPDGTLIWNYPNGGEPVLIDPDPANNHNIISVNGFPPVGPGNATVTLDQDGTVVSTVEFGSQLYDGVDQGRQSNTAADGSTYFAIRDAHGIFTGDHFIKYDINGNVVWTVDVALGPPPTPFNASPRAPIITLGNDFLVYIDPTPAFPFDGVLQLVQFSYNIVVLKTLDGSQVAKFRWGESTRVLGSSPSSVITTNGQPINLSRPPLYPPAT